MSSQVLLFTMPDFSSPELWISLLTLTFLEIILGIDNIIFISIIADKLPVKDQKKARDIGLLLAMGIRILLLTVIAWIISATQPLFEIPFLKDSHGMPIGISIKDLILFAGGIFLIAKSTSEIHGKLEGEDHHVSNTQKVYATMSSVVVQIMLINLVFSFDSILTAVGLTKDIFVMMVSIILSIGIMMAFAGPVSRYISKHPTLQMLALAFHQHVPKGYIYFSIAFSLAVEALNMRLRKVQAPIQMRGPVEEASEEGVLEKM